MELLRLLVDDSIAAPSSLRRHAKEALPDLELRRLDRLYYFACEPEHPLQRIYNRIWAAQRRMFREAVEALMQRGIPALVFKGVEFMSRHFGSRCMHGVGDADVLVPREALGDAVVVLQDLGYDHRTFDYDIQKWYTRDPLDVAQFNATNPVEISELNRALPLSLTDQEIELCRQLKLRCVVFPESAPQCSVAVDLHYNVGRHFQIDHLVQRAVPGALGAGLAFSATDHLWIASLRYYKDGACVKPESLHHLAYLTRHVAKSDIDWDVLVREVTEINGHLHGAPAMFYTLGLLAQIDQRLVPREIIDRLRPIGERRHDWGWQFGKLFGFAEPFPLSLTHGRLDGRPPWTTT